MTRFCSSPPPIAFPSSQTFSDKPQPPMVNEALAFLKGSVGSMVEGGQPERWQPICSSILQLYKGCISPASVQTLQGNATANSVSGQFSSFCRLWQKTAAQQNIMASYLHLLYSCVSCRFLSLQAPLSVCVALCILR